MLEHCVCSKRKFMMIEKCVLCYSSVTRSGACVPLPLPTCITHMRDRERTRKRTLMQTSVSTSQVLMQWQCSGKRKFLSSPRMIVRLVIFYQFVVECFNCLSTYCICRFQFRLLFSQHSNRLCVCVCVFAFCYCYRINILFNSDSKQPKDSSSDTKLQNKRKKRRNSAHKKKHFFK